MDILTIILLAIGLAMDCTAVSMVQGLSADLQKPQDLPKILLMASLFGIFQGGMPLIGYYAGTLFVDFVKIYAPWIGLLLLVFIGGKMIWDSRKEENKDKQSNWSLGYLLLMAVATSIDALTTGILFVPAPEMLWTGVVIIGSVSFIFSCGGVLAGNILGRNSKINMSLIGGIVLIGIGIKIWTEGYLLPLING